MKSPLSFLSFPWGESLTVAASRDGLVCSVSHSQLFGFSFVSISRAYHGQSFSVSRPSKGHRGARAQTRPHFKEGM